MFSNPQSPVLGTVSILAAFLATASPSSATLLDDAVWFERQVGDGIVWRYYHFDDLFSAKQSVSYLEIELDNPAVSLQINFRDSYVGPSPGVGHPDFPRAPTSTLAGEIPNAKGAINGTYFNTSSYDPENPDTPWGGGVTYLKVDGTVIHTFDGSNINSHGMGLLYNDKSDLVIQRKSGAWSGHESLWQNMMICGPVLLENGVVETYDSGNNHANLRHPRSAIGKIDSSNTLILLTVDGRTDQAAGMSCTELAQVLLALGCDDAINLDGGGSTTLWAAGEPFSGVLNYPSDNGSYDRLGQRGAANILAVVSGDPASAQWDARMTGLSYSSLTRSGEELTVTATYTNIGTQTWTASNVSVAPSRPFGRTSAFIPAGEETTFFEMSPASVPQGASATFTLTLTAPDVDFNTLFEENFALWHESEGYFGPADSELKVRTTVRPEIDGAPPLLIVQGTPSGHNNQWYVEPTAGWAPSSVGFTADGVVNSGTQRYCSASTLNRRAEFRPIFDVPGIYKVEVAFPSSTNNITQVRYTVNHLDGTHTQDLNQNPSGGSPNTWILLGEFPFSTDASNELGVHSVTVGNPSMTGNRFYSGAVRFDYVEPLPDPEVENWTVH